MNVDPDEFIIFCNTYYPRLMPEARLSCLAPKELFKLMESGKERHYMKIVSFCKAGTKRGHGLACINVEPNIVTTTK